MDWLTKLKNSKKSCLLQNNLKKIHYEIDKDVEMVEEYNMDTGVLTRRAWRRQTNMGGEGDWDIEIGDPEPTRLQKEICVIKEDSNQVCLYNKKMTHRFLNSCKLFILAVYNQTHYKEYIGMENKKFAISVRCVFSYC